MQMKNDDEEVSYAYNGDGQRVSKTYNGTTTEYFYNGEILAGQKTDDDVIVFMYDNNSDAFGFIYNETEYYYVKNAQNDIIAIADADGTVIANYYYDAWGKSEGITGNTEIANLNPLRYRSYYYDTESELYYLNTRYYSAEIGRFINADNENVVASNLTHCTDKHLYAYCDNNPIVRVDNGGEFWNYVIGGVVGAILGGVSAALSGGDWKSIALGAGVGAVGGLLAASGIPIGWQIVAGGFLSGGSNLVTQTLIDGKRLNQVDWVDVGLDTTIGAVSSVVSYGATKSATKVAEKTINKGISRIVTGRNVLENTGRYGRGAIKKGLKTVRSGVKSLNTARGKSSVIGSAFSGFVTNVKNFFKKLFR